MVKTCSVKSALNSICKYFLHFFMSGYFRYIFEIFMFDPARFQFVRKLSKQPKRNANLMSLNLYNVN